MKYCFDIDGTICSITNGEYEKAVPDLQRIGRINTLFEEGHQITLFTARGSTTGLDWRRLTEEQLEKWGVRYHALLLGKPEADIYVDDRAIKDTDFFNSQTDS